MAAVRTLPVLTACQRCIKLKYNANGRVRSWHARSTCRGGVDRSSVQSSGSCSRRLLGLIRAENSDHSQAAYGPSARDRWLAASMYFWPVSEGIWRLAVVSARIVQYHTLDWLIWNNMHGHKIQLGNDQETLQAVTQGCWRLYQESAHFLQEILQFHVDGPSLLVKHEMVHTFNPSLNHLESVLAIIYMAGVSYFASAAHSQQCQNKPAKKRVTAEDCRQTNEGCWWFRRPQLVMAASSCALLLRLSLVSMQGASGLARDTYKFVAVSLTLASVCTGLAHIMQVAFGRFEEDGNMLLQLVQQASNIAWLHCALSLSDWALMLSMPYSWSAKVHVGITVLVTYILVRKLQHRTLDPNLFRQP